jgi:hypothetical protein
MLFRVYNGNGICLRNHCEVEPSRDIEPPGLVTTVGWKDRASTSYAAADRVEAVLREAVESTVDAQRRLHRLKPEPLQEVDAWLAPFRRFWSAHVDALERHLDRMEHQHQGKGRQGENR